MVNYQNSRVYTIRSYENDDIFISSTTQALSKALSNHTRDYRKFIKGKCKFKPVFNILKNPSYHIEFYKDIPCDTIEQKLKLEREVIRHFNKENSKTSDHVKPTNDLILDYFNLSLSEIPFKTGKC